MQSQTISPQEHELLQDISAERRLGEIDWEQTKKLTGGRIHEVWRLKTDQYDYVIKILNRSKVSKEMLEIYQLAESISAEAKQQGVAAVTANRDNDEVIFTHKDRYYLLFPYIKSSVIKAENIQPENAQKMGELLAKLHKCDFSKIKVSDSKWNYPINRSWHELLNKITDPDIHAKLTAKFTELNALNELDAIHDECLIACEALKTEAGIISHGDLDTPNIVWEEGKPHIIDWEYSGRGRIHPLRDLMTTALYWSQTSPSNIDLTCYEAVFSSYQTILSLPDASKSRAALYAVIGGWMQWIDFNIQRLTDPKTDADQKQLAAKQIEIFVETVLTVKKNENNLLKPCLTQKTENKDSLLGMSFFAPKETSQPDGVKEEKRFSNLV